ncbi:hypothetical protein EYF80_062086 [Liparis tanakae]|uniref:Uncharacterized protein n=1 Tax=Liparis tanakae TaxID=230148 RepID=A0A4Z2EG92_9TELE|nr:hypothetical protein EYF80_062086 [Liparis tanakae]
MKGRRDAVESLFSGDAARGQGSATGLWRRTEGLGGGDDIQKLYRQEMFSQIQRCANANTRLVSPDKETSDRSAEGQPGAFPCGARLRGHGVTGGGAGVNVHQCQAL